MIVPLSRAGDLFLIKQHRYPTNSFSLEVPAGAHEGGGDLEMQDANFVKKPDFCLKIGRSSATYK